MKDIEIVNVLIPSLYWKRNKKNCMADQVFYAGKFSTYDREGMKYHTTSNFTFNHLPFTFDSIGKVLLLIVLEFPVTYIQFVSNCILYLCQIALLTRIISVHTSLFTVFWLVDISRTKPRRLHRQNKFNRETG